MNNAPQKPREPQTFLAFVVFLFCMVTGMAVADQTSMPAPLRIVLSLLAPLAFMYLMAEWRNGIRRMDEMERRIQLDALALAFPISILLVLTLGMLQRVVELPFRDFSYRHVWAMLVFIYFASVAFARRRYA